MAWPLAARAAGAAGCRIPQSRITGRARTPCRRLPARAAGYFEHRNVGIEYLWAEGQNDRLPALADVLVRARVSVICAAGPGAALAAKAATTAIPIVFLSGEEPGKIGLVESYNRPSGNVTGVAVVIERLGAKRLGLLRELIPSGTVIAALLNPRETTFDAQLNDVQEAARAVGQQIQILRASTEREGPPHRKGHLLARLG